MIQWFLVTRRAILFWSVLGLALAASRLAHLHILWADEDYHLAAAIQILHGKVLYRDLWYDKPPGAALLALLFGAYPGWPLRIAGTLFAIATCALAYRFARRLWSPREGYIAAALLGFTQVFYFAPGVIRLQASRSC
jgi:4-amino-4-deoxy-L-arabinose transferase-like glycosyltransferase